MRQANQATNRNIRPAIGWLIVGLPIVALLLRFAMRALGVRPDVPFPGFIYSLTAPIVDPFYRFLPASSRFDTNVFEPAAVLAAISVFVAAVVVYLLAILLITVRSARS